MKYVLSTILGLLVGLISLITLVYVSILIFTLPKGIDVFNLESIRENIDYIPDINLAMIVVAYGLASFLAGFICVKIHTENPTIPIFIIGVLLTILGFVNFIFIPYPLWVLVVGSFTFLPLARLGGSLGLDKPF